MNLLRYGLAVAELIGAPLARALRARPVTKPASGPVRVQVPTPGLVLPSVQARGDEPGWLVPLAQREDSPFVYVAGDTRVHPVECILYHWTGSPWGRDNEARMRSWFRGERGRSSTHFVVLRSGKSLQGATLLERAWHAGESKWSGRSGVNAISIGLDFDNAGPLVVRNGEIAVKARDAAGKVVYRPHGGDGVRIGSKWYDPYTPEQIATALELTARLAGTLDLKPKAASRPRSAQRVTGHEHVAPRRKIDPGPCMPWPLFDRALADRKAPDFDWHDWPGIRPAGQGDPVA